MKTVNCKSINKKIKVNGLKARELGILIKHFNRLKALSEEDLAVKEALNGFIYLCSKREEITFSAVMMFLPQVLDVLWEELKSIYMAFFELTEEEFNNLDLDELVLLFITFMEEIDLNKLVDLLGKYTTQPSNKVADKKKA